MQENIPHGLHEWRGHTVENIPWAVHRGDVNTVLNTLEENYYNCCVTSPPYYWQRDYKVEGQIGLEQTIDGYVNAIVESMRNLRRVLTRDGLLFLNLGDTYYSAKGQPKGSDKKNGARRFGLRAVDASGLGVPRKTAIGIPWRVALRMIEDGWTLRSPIIWQRLGSLPEPTAHDRPWRTYETLFMFSKSPRYYFCRDNLNGVEDIWTISERPRSSKGIHSAAFPDQLVERCLAVGCPEGGRVIDPFVGSGTVLRVALELGHSATGIDLNEQYCDYVVRELNTL
ncbi:DNA-methyltransferase [Capsulimonas corticalis]|uniref:DNA-methyltransferase n=1 Tax=Capsulimonas corticalis TaxID=2219043 RepID=UPI0014020DC1|nr:site-specific DNA-methyltransferase [Capsulimonas corticalis]